MNLKKVNWLQVIIFVLVFVIVFLASKYFGFTLEDITDHIEAVAGSVSALAVIIGLYAKLTGSVKAKKLAEQLNLASEYAQDAVEIAEESENWTGAEKKKWALTYVNQKCIEAGITYDEDQVSELIEQFVELSLKVNARHAAEEEIEEGGEL